MDLNQATDIEIVKYCAHNPEDREAWIVFVTRFEWRIKQSLVRQGRNMGIIRSVRLQRELLQDLVQEVYSKLIRRNFKALRTFKGKDSPQFYAFLSVISLNVLRNHQKHETSQKRPKIAASLDDLFEAVAHSQHTLKDILPAPDDEEIEKLKREAIWEEIIDILRQHLPSRNTERDIDIFEKVERNGHNPAEVARSYGLSKKRVTNVIGLIKQTLRNKMKRGRTFDE